MAPPPPLIALKDARLGFGGKPLFDGLEMGLVRGDKVCLVGRNGSGKSTLLRVLAGLQELDAGERVAQGGVAVGYLPQEPSLPAGRTVRDHVGEGLAETEAYRVDAVLDRLQVDGARDLATLSGGEGRRAALARALVHRPDVLLLDEPTNHLDLPTVEWLEEELKRHDGALLVISHDRAFLRNVSRATLWLDRGVVHRMDRNFAHFDDWAEEVRTAEAKKMHRLGRKIEREEHWLHRGVTARRKRNQRRVAELGELRQRRREMLRGQPGEVRMAVSEAERSGKLVIEAEQISKTFETTEGAPLPVVEDFSTRILRGDRVGVVGPNGAGKTTLVRLLLGHIEPDSGSVRHGTRLEPAYYDQRRESLEPETSLWRTLAPHGDSVIVNGRQRHVVGYLRDFLFEEAQALQPVKSLSGGERNRLLLARLFARPSNLMVMDEPTNDLDMDTLDLLVEVLSDYDGTLIVVSHDRDFLDRLATSVIAVEGRGRVTEYAGGYSDALDQRGSGFEALGGPAGQARGGKKKPQKAGKAEAAPSGKANGGKRKLSYKESRELAALPDEIARLEKEIATLERELSDADLYRRDPDRFQQATDRLDEVHRTLSDKESRWLELEDRRERLAAGEDA